MKKLFLITGVLFLFGCSEDVSWNTQEEMRKTARENGEYNAKRWRNANAKDYNIKSRGDSTIGEDCAQGDGWASVDLIKLNDQGHTVHSISLKCSTASAEIGCMEKEDFQSKVYSDEEGRCNTNLPIPLPKLTGN